MLDSQILILEVTTSGRADVLVLEALHREASHALVSRARLKEAFHEQLVWLGEHAIRPATVLGPGRHEITIKEWKSLTQSFAHPSPRGAFLPILVEDAELLIMNKSSGVPSVPHSPDEVDTAVGAALAHLLAHGKSLEDIRTLNPEKPLESGLLHRLDTGTSGVLAFAKTHEAYLRLARAWRDREVRKVYRAIVISDSNPLPGGYPSTLRLEMAHDAKSSRRMIALTDDLLKMKDVMKKRVRGKPLPTVTHLLSAHEVPGGGAMSGATGDRTADAPALRAWDVTIEIETGVMHQIRCALAAIGAPILGDPIYGKGQNGSKGSLGDKGSGAGKNAERSTSRPKHAAVYSAQERLWLHAWRLEIPSKSAASGKLIAEAPLPPGWPVPRSQS